MANATPVVSKSNPQFVFPELLHVFYTQSLQLETRQAESVTSPRKHLFIPQISGRLEIAPQHSVNSITLLQAKHPNNSMTLGETTKAITNTLPPPSHLSNRKASPMSAIDHENGEPSWALKAQELNNCPFYAKGDALQIRLPGVFGVGPQLCSMPVASFIPHALSGTQSEGNIESGFKQCSCRWSFCRVEKLVHATDELEDVLTAESQMQLPFLEQLPAPVARALRERSIPRTYPADAVILEEGVTSAEFHVLIKGSARIATSGTDGRVIELNVLRKGDCFGEMSILTGAATSNRVESVEESLTLAMPRVMLQRMLADYPVLSIILYRMLSKRIRASNQKLIQLLSPSLSGDLHSLSFIDLVQTVHGVRLTGVLIIDAGPSQQARIGFREGQMMSAESPGHKGEAALDWAIRLISGAFSFAAQKELPTQNLSGDTMGLLLDAVRKMDESTIIERRDLE